MTRLMLLTTATGHRASGGGGGGDPDPEPEPDAPVDTWPTTSDPTLLALRPAGRNLGAVTVDTNYPSSTNNKHLIGDGLTRAVAVQNADAYTGGQTNGYWDGIGPDYRVDVFAAPDTYNEVTAPGAWTNLCGATEARTAGDRGAGVVVTDGAETGGVFHTFGSTYLEGITLKATSDDSTYGPKYPWHITGGQVMIAAHCTFDVTEAAGGVEGSTAGLVGMDGASGAFVVFYRCRFRGGPEVDGFNMHGSDGQTAPIIWVFAECEFEDVADVGMGGSEVEGGGYNKVYVIDCTGVPSLSANEWTDVYTDTGLTATGAHATHAASSWPIPDAGGLSEEWATYYYPSTIGDEPVTWTPDVPDAGNMVVTAGRTYVCRLDPDTAMHVTGARVNVVTTASADCGIRYTPADTPYERDIAPTAEEVTPGTPAVLGANTWTHYYPYTRYPGDNGFWVKVAFSTAATVTGSADLPGITDCYYTDDGDTLTPVSEGTAFPLLTLVAST